MANKCAACPAGKTNEPNDAATGPDTNCDVRLCKANERVKDNNCVACDVGYENAAGDDPAGADTQCDGEWGLLVAFARRVARAVDTCWHAATRAPGFHA